MMIKITKMKCLKCYYYLKERDDCNIPIGLRTLQQCDYGQWLFKQLEKEKSVNLDGFINESFEHLIDRTPISRITTHIIGLRREMIENKISEERKKILLERIEYCFKKLRS